MIAIVQLKKPDKYRPTVFSIPEGVDVDAYLKYVTSDNLKSYELKEKKQ